MIGSFEGPASRPRLEIPGHRIQRELGRGGMGIVYLAEQEQPQRLVAIKLLRLDNLVPEEVRRFRREAEILGRLRHPGIARVHTAGMVESEQGPRPWIAMEFIRGEPLREYVFTRALNLKDIVELFTELCDAVQHAHQQGVVHRDIKPSNVLVDERGHVSVLDFGVARIVAEGPMGPALATQNGHMVGTVAYASPEQVTGQNDAVSSRSDVYSLGVLLQELLTGALPYVVDELRVVETIHSICEEEPRRLRKLRRDAPADLETVLLKALEKDPARRYADAGALAADLRAVMAEQPVSAKAPSAIYQARKFMRRHRAFTSSAVVVIGALLVTVAVLFSSRRNDREQLARNRSMLDLMAREVFRLVPALGFGYEYRDSLEALDLRLAEELEREPADFALLSYRARSLYELGALDHARGDFESARERLEQAFAIRSGLLERDPADVESRVHLSQLFAKLGDVAGQMEDPEGQYTWYLRAFELDKRLVGEHPGNGELIEDLGWSLERMADQALRRGDRVEAKRLMTWRLADAVRLAEEDPDNWKFLYNAAQGHDAISRLSGPEESSKHQTEFVRLARRLHDLQPQRSDFLYLWAAANHGLAHRALSEGAEEQALFYSEEAFGLAIQLVSREPESARHVELMRWVSTVLVDGCLAGGEREKASSAVLRLRLAAGIVGEESVNGHMLLAIAAFREVDLQTTNEARRKLEEQALAELESLLLLPEAGVKEAERVAKLLRADGQWLRADFCRRLESRHGPAGALLMDRFRATEGSGPTGVPMEAGFELR